MDDVAPPAIKPSDATCYASLLSSCFLENSIYLGGNLINSFQKLVGNLDKRTVANLGSQHQRFLDSYFKSS
jgi:hypothetical protein